MHCKLVNFIEIAPTKTKKDTNNSELSETDAEKTKLCSRIILQEKANENKNNTFFIEQGIIFMLSGQREVNMPPKFCVVEQTER